MNELLNYVFFFQRPGLSKETFAANMHTCRSLVLLSKYLLENIGFQYVLLGKIQSDCLEERFGWMRQLSGANYFLSVRQILENDKKIRAISLLSFSKLSISDIDIANKEVTNNRDGALQFEASHLASEMYSDMAMDITPNDSDNAVIYYVSGAACRSIVRSFRCDSCRESLIVDDTSSVFEASDLPECSNLTTIVSRGGLYHPQKHVFSLGILCWKAFFEIKAIPVLKQKFLKFENQMLLFCKLLEFALEDDIDSFFGRTHCTAGHDLTVQFCMRFFKCMCKNLISETNDNVQNQPEKQKRKILKLQSDVR